APVRIKIDNGHVAQCQMLIDVDLRAVGNHFDWLATTSNRHTTCSNAPLIGRVCSGSRGVVMKTLLYVFRQLGKINFRNSRLAFEHNAIGFDAAYRDVFVFLPADQLEIVSENYRSKTEDQKCKRSHLKPIENDSR